MEIKSDVETINYDVYSDLLRGLDGFSERSEEVDSNAARLRVVLTSDTSPAAYYAAKGPHQIMRGAETCYTFGDIFVM